MPDRHVEIVEGEAPTAADEQYVAAASSLGPEKVVERLDTFGKYLLGLSTLAATLLGGFGMLSATELAASPWLLMPMTLFSISLGCAVWGITPQTARINRNNIASVAEYYDELIAEHGKSVRRAGLFFAVGIFTVPIAIGLTKASGLWGKQADIRTSGQLMTVSGNKSFAGSVEAADVPRGTCVRTTVTAGPSVLLDRLTHPGTNGTAIVTLAIEQIDASIPGVSVASTAEPCSAPVTLSVH